jgi:hypothetical protein
MEQLSFLCAAVFSIMDMKVIDSQKNGESRTHDPFAEYVRLYGKFQFISDDVARSLLSKNRSGKFLSRMNRM